MHMSPEKTKFKIRQTLDVASTVLFYIQFLQQCLFTTSQRLGEGPFYIIYSGL